MAAKNIVFKREFEVSTGDIQKEAVTVWSVAFDPLGKCVLIGTNKNILILDIKSGKLIHTINEHEGSVYCVAFCANGKQFASGGSDKNVMLWNRNGEGILKYNHNYSILFLKYNPITFELISTTSNDICIWNTKHNKRSHKSNINAKCLALDWAQNGKLFAMALQDNSVSIHDKLGKQIYCIDHKHDKNKHHNIVCCKFYDSQRLIVASWNKILSFYDIEYDGNPHRFKIKNVFNTKLDFYPNTICSMKNSCLIFSGLDSYLYLYTAQGTFVEKYKDNYGKNNKQNKRDWILSICNQEKSKTFCYGTNNGYVICNKLIFKTVHSLQDNLYAYRAHNLCNLYNASI